jgi:hypothetical protein
MLCNLLNYSPVPSERDGNGEGEGKGQGEDVRER